MLKKYFNLKRNDIEKYIFFKKKKSDYELKANENSELIKYG